MPFLVWDASALSKRYSLEGGMEVVDALLLGPEGWEMATTIWGYAETLSILIRRRNDGRIGRDAFVQAASALDREVFEGRFRLIPIPDGTVLAATALMEDHNLNATDAAILRAMLDLLDEEDRARVIVLVASDRRFLRAAEAEGLRTINPDAVTPEEAIARVEALSSSP